jgi:hypothetical protein
MGSPSDQIFCLQIFSSNGSILDPDPCLEWILQKNNFAKLFQLKNFKIVKA